MRNVRISIIDTRPTKKITIMKELNIENQWIYKNNFTKILHVTKAIIINNYLLILDVEKMSDQDIYQNDLCI